MYLMPNGEQEQALEGEGVVAKVASGLLMVKGMEEATTRVMRKKSSRLLA